MKKIIKKIKDYFNNEKGSMMIEAVVALTLVTVGMLGIFSLATNSMKMNRTVNNRFVAANLAAESVEVVKNIIDTNITQGKPWNDGIRSGTAIVSYDSYSLGAGDTKIKIRADKYRHHVSGTETIFERHVELDESTNSVKVEAVVSWEEDGNERSLTVEDHFYNWRRGN